ncbi:MAG TPA: hypothetical protein VLB69_12455 [Rudaea sp.]|nr:hypothetical protein [Rudaea sp.]
MSERELSFHELTRRLRLRELPMSEPSSDLWQRIADAHQGRLRRARVRRGIVGSGVAAMALAALIIAPKWPAPAAEGDVDWLARAQALELQLRALEATRGAHADSTGALDTQAEIARIDNALQAAYDTGAEREQLAPLWKRRSELLGTLISVRQRHVEISRI